MANSEISGDKLSGDEISGDDELSLLAEEFVARYREGDRPSLSDYARRYPRHAQEIRDLFPAFIAMENMAQSEAVGAATSAGRDTEGSLRSPRPEQLGDYRIVREIGRGGMGVVYEAEHLSLGKRVALKLLSAGALSSTVQLQRFEREARTAARLHHTNIVPVFGVGHCEGLHYYAMQYIPGRSLEGLLEEWKSPRPLSNATAPEGASQVDCTASVQDAASRGPAAAGPGRGHWNLVAKIGLQAAEALAYAGSQGVLHRDIKPSNLLLDDDGTLWITDFGLAKVIGDGALTETGDLLGTLRYMAPETLEGRFDQRSDLFSLGLTLYELLALRPAYGETTRQQLLRQVTEGQLAPLCRFVREIPRDLETIVMKAASRDPAARYATARAMADDLQRFLADQPIKARPLGPSERLWRWSRRNPLVAGLASTIAVIFVAVAMGSAIAAVHFGRLSQDERREREAAQEQLRSSLVEQAKIRRQAGGVGQRFAGLKALTAAARIRITPETRNEAIGCLALADMRPIRSWDCQEFGHAEIDIDHRLERYAIGDTDGNIRICRVADNVELERLPGDGILVGPLFSRDGRYLAARPVDVGRCRIWDLESSTPKTVVEYDQVCWAVDISSDGRYAAIGLNAGGPIRLHALPSGELLRLIGDGESPGRLKFDPSGPRFAASRGSTILVYDIEDGELVTELPQSANVNDLVWQPPGDQLAVLGGDEQVYLWDVASRRCTAVVEGVTGGGTRLAFNPRGDVLVDVNWGGRLRFWDPRIGLPMFSTRTTHKALRFGPDNRLLTVAPGEQGFQLWELVTSQVYRRLARTPRHILDVYHTCAVGRNGRLLAAAMQDGIALFDLASGRYLETLPTASCFSLQFETSGTLLACGPNGLWRWPIASEAGEPALRIGPPQRIDVPGYTCQASASGDGRVLAVAVHDGAVVLRADRPGEPIRLTPQDDVRYVAVSPEGRWVATGSHGGHQFVKIWDAESGQCLREFPQTRGSAVMFSPDGKWLVGVSNRFQTWEVGSWRSGSELPVGPGGIAFSPDGKLMATGATDDGGIRLIEVSSGREIALLPDLQRQPVCRLWFAGPDGEKLVYIGNEHRSLQVWDLRAAAEGLAAAGFGSHLPAYPPATADADLPPLSVEIDTGSSKRP